MSEMDRTARSLAERFSTFVEYARWTAGAPQPTSITLEAARLHRFTGEITFATDPVVRVYADDGVVYFAERVGDPSISQMLRETGIVQPGQLERGVVRVGDVEHLGRLFDRDTSIDRDAVMVLIEARTEAVVAALASHPPAQLQAGSFRHHPSGIHRWFVAPVEPVGCSRPVSEVAQVDTSVVDDIPSLQSSMPAPVAPAPSAPAASAPLERPTSTPPPPPPQAELPQAQAPNAATAAQHEFDLFDADIEDWSASSGGQLRDFRIVWPDGTEDDALSGDPGAPFVDRRVSHLEASTPESEPTPEVPKPPASVRLTAPAVEPVPAPTPTPVPVEPPAPEQLPVAADAETAPLPMPSFQLAPLQVASLPEPDAAVPDDVAAAVRRALRAIETASATGAVELASEPINLQIDVTPPPAAPEPQALVAPQSAPIAEPVPVASPAAPLAPPEPAPVAQPAPAPVAQPAPAPVAQPAPAPVVQPAPVAQPVQLETPQPEPTREPATQPQVARQPAPEPRPEPVREPEPAPKLDAPAFAPPTDDMRAEAVYARAIAAAQAEDGGDIASNKVPDGGRGRASVVFVDEEFDEDSKRQSDRRGALRRLISSLRPKDD